MCHIFQLPAKWTDQNPDTMPWWDLVTQWGHRKYGKTMKTFMKHTILFIWVLKTRLASSVPHGDMARSQLNQWPIFCHPNQKQKQFKCCTATNKNATAASINIMYCFFPPWLDSSHSSCWKASMKELLMSGFEAAIRVTVISKSLPDLNQATAAIAIT